MEKIRELLKQMGASQELQDNILESIKSYKTTIEASLAEEFKKRLEAAKQVCVEEVEREKAELRRKTEIFLESRINTIDREAQKQVAIGESEATRKLKGVKALVEGVQIGGKAEGDQAALAAENKALRIKVHQLSESVARATEKSARANEVAIKALRRNKVLESKAAETTTVAEAKTEPRKATLEGVRRPSATPQTTRPVVAEAKAKTVSGDPEIAGIASQLDGNPAFIG